MNISVSKLLNLYFDPIDINSIPVQKGIFRGVAIDVAIENYFHSKIIELPNINSIIKRITSNEVKSEAVELYKESKHCLNAFTKFISENNVVFEKVQIYVKNDAIGMHGYLDALIKINGQNYIVDWKSKGIFKAYSESELNDEAYDDYFKWCNNNGYNPKSQTLFIKEKLEKFTNYALGHLRYCLQVSLYWIIIGQPRDYKPLVAYFDTNENYFLYTFNLKKILPICQSFLDFKNSSKVQQNQINEKLKSINWKKIINWRKIH